MTLWTILPKWLWSSANASRRFVGQRILSMDRFQATLERERMRADRSGSHFSLVEFDLERIDQELRDRVIGLLERRLRATDELGELTNGLGVLLPATSAVGAQQLVENAMGELAIGGKLKGTIRQYPETDVQAVPLPVFSAQHVTTPTATTASLFVKPLPLWKRAVDVLAASAGILLLSPLLLIAAAAIKVTSRGPVFFLQKRTGLGGEPFTIYKLRTMHIDADSMKQQLRSQSEQDGPAFKIEDDPRITTVGKYLRKTCIDELPQLWNVLAGNMTLVGPRPLPCDEADACKNWERRRLDVTPGLTCTW